jgi:cell division protein FtsZ
MINVDFADVRTVMSEMGMAMMGTGRAAGENRARDAAEAAIRSPLLEDVDLQGARGVLVNITAGPDLSIGEYTDVGETINAFTSERGLVVIGTVIDTEAAEELRVTVVATGLGEALLPSVVVDNTFEGDDTDGGEGGRPDYDDLDRPTVMRKKRRASSTREVPSEQSENMDADYLDIPAFLRRQAD